MAVTLGMGTNAAYVESPQVVPKWEALQVISKEWGNFSSFHLPITKHDASLDAGSSNLGPRKADTSEDHEVVGEKLEEIFEITDSTAMTRELVVEVCHIVAERGARIVGAGIVGILKKLRRIEHKRSVVSVGRWTL
ncbi:hypothetical protein Pint_27806 [Pistacia integerrima]|uniref:Uncharacterized protein n=1 Tax=Pistacia integerrima TaxID=434235 RepID=A0ACC0YP71_9ROSI|nr:hypothetical protein Pint_27806 [Pistacia integerrima]